MDNTFCSKRFCIFSIKLSRNTFCAQSAAVRSTGGNAANEMHTYVTSYVVIFGLESRSFDVMSKRLCGGKEIEREKLLYYFKRARMCDDGRDGVGLAYIFIIWTRSYRRGRSVFTIYVRTYVRMYECMYVCIYSCGGGKLSDEAVRGRADLGGEGQWMWPVYRIVVGTHSTRWQSDEYAGARPPLCRHSHTHTQIHIYTTHWLVTPATVSEQSVYVTRPLCRYTG